MQPNFDPSLYKIEFFSNFDVNYNSYESQSNDVLEWDLLRKVVFDEYESEIG